MQAQWEFNQTKHRTCNCNNTCLAPHVPNLTWTGALRTYASIIPAVGLVPRLSLDASVTRFVQNRYSKGWSAAMPDRQSNCLLCCNRKNSDAAWQNHDSLFIFFLLTDIWWHPPIPLYAVSVTLTEECTLAIYSIKRMHPSNLFRTRKLASSASNIAFNCVHCKILWVEESWIPDASIYKTFGST